MLGVGDVAVAGQLVAFVAVLSAALSVALLVPAAQAAQPKFFDNLSGSWSVSGQA